MDFETTLVPLPERPTREDLRLAHAVLKPLAAMKHPGAAEELRAVDALTRDLYPRRAKGDAPDRPKRGRNRRQKRLIMAGDCVGVCPDCRGTGRNGSSRLQCPACHGVGTRPLAVAQVMADGPGAREVIMRGDYADPEGGVSLLQDHTPTPHIRGYATGRLIGPLTKADRHEFSRWQRQTTKSASGVTPEDLSAHREGAAIARVGDDEFGLDKKPRNQRRMGSPRDPRTLTPGQGRRSLMEDRVRRLNAELRRLERKRSGYYQRVMACRTAKRALRRMGVDIDAIEREWLMKQPKVEYDPPTIAEARRRGDLPPTDPAPRQDDDAVAASLAPIVARILKTAEAAEGASRG